MKTTETETDMPSSNVNGQESAESVLRDEENLWWEGFVKKVGLRTGVNSGGVERVVSPRRQGNCCRPAALLLLRASSAVYDMRAA